MGKELLGLRNREDRTAGGPRIRAAVCRFSVQVHYSRRVGIIIFRTVMLHAY